MNFEPNKSMAYGLFAGGMAANVGLTAWGNKVRKNHSVIGGLMVGNGLINMAAGGALIGTKQGRALIADSYSHVIKSVHGIK